MLGTKAIGAVLALAGCALAADFSGTRALESTRKAVALGPRPAGSPAIAKLQTMIKAELTANGWQVSEDVFTAVTPVGKVTMRNIIGKLAGKSGRAVVFTGHYDTKAIPGVKFVGANDGGASTGWLLDERSIFRPGCFSRNWTTRGTRYKRPNDMGALILTTPVGCVRKWLTFPSERATASMIFRHSA